MCGRLRVGKENLHAALLVGAAMCSAYLARFTRPLAMTVTIFALELLVMFLQAYVFAILTCIYLNDAIHPGH